MLWVACVESAASGATCLGDAEGGCLRFALLTLVQLQRARSLFTEGGFPVQLSIRRYLQNVVTMSWQRYPTRGWPIPFGLAACSGLSGTRKKRSASCGISSACVLGLAESQLGCPPSLNTAPPTVSRSRIILARVPRGCLNARRKKKHAG